MPTLSIIQPMCGLLMQQDMEDEQSESARPPLKRGYRYVAVAAVV